jgi:hypothetical protein
MSLRNILGKFLNVQIITLLEVKGRMDRITTILISGFMIGTITFLGFFLTTIYDYSLLGIPSLEEFIAMCGLIILIISGFFLISLKTNSYQV